MEVEGERLLFHLECTSANINAALERLGVPSSHFLSIVPSLSNLKIGDSVTFNFSEQSFTITRQAEDNFICKKKPPIEWLDNNY